ncbi:amidohydrolase family protein [Peterkaempfera bronchialis]|uniref:Hydrolase n=1 Tax=Peterkaempfera bronchialis TaxID=2126346 RepID=A0A345SWI3_9ACTN|nr:amidohydrolase family protein [Peterkaempfera bronchialis]AXI78088.1 hydrolase [Peterkaempfera bronchialis]
MPSDGAPPVLLLTGARLLDGRVVDVSISGDRIQAVGTAGSLRCPPPAAGDQPGLRIDLGGYLLLPAPAEPHAHLDAAFSAALPGPPPEDGRDLLRRVSEAALTGLGYGATAQRTHVRIGDVHGLARLETVLQARRALRGLVDLQAVAMPRLLTGAAGAAARELLREALKMGAYAVGGCPDLDPDPAGYAEELVGIAGEFGCPVDLHTDGADPARLARLTGVLGTVRPRAAIGPCTRLGLLPDETAARCADRLAAAGVAVVCLPQSGTCTGSAEPPGAGGAQPPALRPSPARLLRRAGVAVAAGSGALRDLSNPVGRADPLEAAFLLSATGTLEAEAAYEAVSSGARAVLGLPEVRVEAGFPAELLAVRGDSLAGVLAGGQSRLVVHAGRVASRTSAVREFADTTTLPLPRQARSAPPE